MRLTLFAATLVQDSALSVSGVDREGSADHPFALVDGGPVLSGRGLKGAAVAMAHRFFDPLPESIAAAPDRHRSFRRSAWEFASARPEPGAAVRLQVRAGVGIRQKTGARSEDILYDREVVPAGTRWPLVLRVDWLHAGAEAEEAEGILGYVLAQHWAYGRCWLGGAVSRGLGWCHIEHLRAWRLDSAAYERWVQSGRDLAALSDPLPEIPTVRPTRSWCFRTLTARVEFGEYRPDPHGPAWGLDMLAVGAHEMEQGQQPAGTGLWACPAWAVGGSPPEVLATDRTMVMEGGRPLLPGASLRGPMRHAFSRWLRAQGQVVMDPHLVQGQVGPEDPAGRVFGTVAQSSRVLIRDAMASDGWAAARLHMHAEDEFTAGSFGSAKRDAVRLLRGQFPVCIVVEGPDEAAVSRLMQAVDRLVALGGLGHLPVGGHKTRGAGWGHWVADGWRNDDVRKERDWQPPALQPDSGRQAGGTPPADSGYGEGMEAVWIRRQSGLLEGGELTLDLAVASVPQAVQEALVAWWCEPTIDLTAGTAPPTFGRGRPAGRFPVDEVLLFAPRACWHAARTGSGIRWVLIEEVPAGTPGTQPATARRERAWLHGGQFGQRFAQAAAFGAGPVVLRQWYMGDEVVGLTLVEAGSGV